jgi:hypothetical protein
MRKTVKKDTLMSKAKNIKEMNIQSLRTEGSKGKAVNAAMRSVVEQLINIRAADSDAVVNNAVAKAAQESKGAAEKLLKTPVRNLHPLVSNEPESVASVQTINQLVEFVKNDFNADVPMQKVRSILAKSQSAALACEGAYQKNLSVVLKQGLENAGFWRDLAIYEIALFAYANPEHVFLVEDLRAHVEAKIGPALNDARVWGGLIRTAANLGYVEKTEAFGWTSRATYNACPKRAWKTCATQAPKRKSAEMIRKQNEFLRLQVKRSIELSYLSALKVASVKNSK